MPKTVKNRSVDHLVIDQRVPEWGVPLRVSTAVPIAASGVQVKSTKDVSKGMYTVLRSKLRKDSKLVTDIRKTLEAARKTQPKQTHSGTFFRSGYRAAKSGGFIARKTGKATVKGTAPQL